MLIVFLATAYSLALTMLLSVAKSVKLSTSDTASTDRLPSPPKMGKDT